MYVGSRALHLPLFPRQAVEGQTEEVQVLVGFGRLFVGATGKLVSCFSGLFGAAVGPQDGPPVFCTACSGPRDLLVFVGSHCSEGVTYGAGCVPAWFKKTRSLHVLARACSATCVA